MKHAHDGNDRAVSALIAAGAIVDVGLSHAWLKGWVVDGCFLIYSGANVEDVDAKNKTPLLMAAALGHIATVRVLVEEGRADPENRGSGNGPTPLFFASTHGHIQIVFMLLAAGANKNTTKKADGTGSTALIAASQHGSLDVVSLLLHSTVELDSKNTHEQTALTVACISGHTDIVALLLEYGAGVNVGNPLCMAASHGHTDVVALLLEHGADIEKVRVVRMYHHVRANTGEAAFDNYILTLTPHAGA